MLPGAVFLLKDTILKFSAFITASALTLGLGNVAHAQLTTAAEVKPILDMTQANWVGVRVWDGQDLLYFSHLEAFRCGLAGVRYGINGAAPNEPYGLEACYEGTAAPNAMNPAEHPPYMAFPVGSVHSVTIQIKFDDGSISEARFERAQIQIQ